jgi:cell division protein FtsI (penicillin-binding protein 3)
MTEADLARLRKWNLLSTNDELSPGLWMVRESRRSYPHEELASHVLGTVNLDSQGIEGIELWKESVLKGKVASISALRDGLGRPTFIDAEAAKELEDGSSIQLTLDSSLQFAVEQELKTAVTRHGAVGGSVIVMDSVTGEILAMANEPSFNPAEGTPSPARRRNRALTDGYEPGSIMKPLVLAGALSNGWKTSDKVYGEHGSFVVQGHRISEAEADEKFEWIPLAKMIQVSSNVVAAKLALKLGADKLNGVIWSFGFGSKSGMGFPGEISGIVPPKKDWKPINIANIGFGHGILVTPIQMLRAYAALANGGHLIQPRIIRKISAPNEGDNPAISEGGADPEVDSSLSPTATRILSEHVVRETVEAMALVTEEGGTGIKAHLDGYRVAGKTGTAQVVDPKTGRYSRSRYNASFVGFPVGVDPRVVIFASVQEPKGIYYASETAAPLFRSVLQAAVNRFSIPSDKRYISTPPTTLAELPGKAPATRTPGAEATRFVESASPVVVARELQVELARDAGPSSELADSEDGAEGALQWRMPSLAGLTSREALRLIGARRFKLEIQGDGVVVRQTPPAGELVAEGMKVRMELGDP